MIAPPETIVVETRRVRCDGASAIRGGTNFRPSALGHPRVWLEIDEHGYVDCGYCDRRFVLKGGPADGADQASLPDISSGASNLNG
jgi:NADH dehydrogenase (ubiquinone) Fe-S protein 6